LSDSPTSTGPGNRRRALLIAAAAAVLVAAIVIIAVALNGGSKKAPSPAPNPAGSTGSAGSSGSAGTSSGTSAGPGSTPGTSSTATGSTGATSATPTRSSTAPGTVPSVIGLRSQQAIQAIQDAGYQVVTKYVTSTAAANDTVTDQSPRAGSPQPPDTLVTISVVRNTLLSGSPVK
jgi:hypothetical protein